MSHRRPSRPPSYFFAQRMKELRDKRRWRSQQALAEQLQADGLHLDRSAVAKIETGARAVTLNEALAITATLGVAFVDMVAKPDEVGARYEWTKAGALRLVQKKGPDIAITDRLHWSPRRVHDWIIGRSPLRRERDELFYAEAPRLADELDEIRRLGQLLVDLEESVLLALAGQLDDAGRGRARDLLQLANITLNSVSRLLQASEERR